VPKVISRDGEPFQVLLRRFKKSCEKASLLSDVKKNKFYVKPSTKNRDALKAAKRKALKQLRRNTRFRKSY